MSFRDSACEHLSKYKLDTLGIHEDGIFVYEKDELRKSHILPLSRRNDNIHQRYRDQFFSSEDGNIKLHRYFHHLNSSQALCINLFCPMIFEKRLDYFPQFLNLKMSQPYIPAFEKDGIEKTGRRTSFDFHLQDSESNEIYVEVKYSEDGFGRAKNDDEHRRKFHETYLPLVKASRYLTSQCSEEKTFLEHYQVLRNLVHIGPAANVVFLFPSANEPVENEAAFAREYFLNPEGRKKFHIVHLESFVAFLNDKSEEPWGEYYQDFREKYCFYDTHALPT
jgi:hypothetical protein